MDQRALHPDRHNHPAAVPSAADAADWAAFFPRFALDERATALARDDHAPQGERDEFSARAAPVGLRADALPPSRLTALRSPRAA